jgi:Protein of unknown function (DUF669)
MAEDEPIGIIELEENLADVEKPPEIPAGKYTAEIQDVQEQTSAKGNTYFAIQFHIAPEELPQDIADQYEDGATLFWNRVMKPRGRADRRGMFNLRRFIEALGLDSNTTTIDPNEWMGRPARLHVVMGKWQGEERAEIRAVEAAEEKAPPPRARAAGRGNRRGASAE